MRTLAWMLPLAIGLGIYGVATRLLLERGWALGTWLLAAFLVGHGLIHLGYATPVPAGPSPDGIDYPFDLAKSWLVGAGLDVTLVRAIGIALTVVVVLGFALAGLATMGWLVPAAWWPALVTVGAAASLALLVVGFAPTVALGLAIDAVLLWLVLVATWAPARGAPLPV